MSDRLNSGSYQDIRKALPGISIVQVIHVSTEESLNEAQKISPLVDAILLDSGNQFLERFYVRAFLRQTFT